VQDAGHRKDWQASSQDVIDHASNPDADRLKLRQDAMSGVLLPSKVNKKREEPAEIKEDVSEDEITERLKKVYEYYCAYAPSAPAIDNMKWTKAVVDMGLIDDKKLTKTDVDLIFAKVKAKSARRIELDGWVAGLTEVATKLYPKSSGVKSPLAALVATDLRDLSLGGGGGARLESKDSLNMTDLAHALPSDKASSVVDRLTDTSKFTGTHKHRFDETGQGKGLAGRESVPKKEVMPKKKT